LKLNNLVEITWISKSEEDFSHYELEWSGDGKSFATLEIQEGLGRSFSERVYTLIDRQSSAENFYRLKMVDDDGTAECSKIISATSDCAKNEKTILYPNPLKKSRGELNVKFHTPRENTVVEIRNLLGAIVQKVQLNSNNTRDWNQVALDVSSLPSGTYSLKIIGQKTTSRFVIVE